jgi:hypothetical protein
MARVAIALVAVLLTAHSVRAQDPVGEGWVVLPIDEYRTLRSSAFPSLPGRPAPPVKSALTRVDYALTVGDDTISGQVTLAIDVLDEGWVSVNLPSGLMVRDATLDGRRTRIVDGTPPRVLIARTGRSTLVLDVVVPLQTAGGTESMTLPASGSAVSAVSLTIPRTNVDLNVTGGFVASHSDSSAESRWSVYGNPGKPVEFSWKRRADDRRAALPLRVRSRITELVSLGEDVSQLTASVLVEVVQGTARDIVLTVPEGVAINQVQGAVVADWAHTERALTISFVEPVLSGTSVIINADARLARDGDVSIPILRMPTAERETGGLAVDVSGAGEINRIRPRGLDAADVSELGDVVAGRESASMVAFRFRPVAGALPRELTVALTRYTLQPVLVASVEEARFDALLVEDGKALVRARYGVRNNQRSFLAVTLPSQSTLWSASLAGEPVRPGLAASGALLLPLQKGRSGEDAPTFVVELTYLQRTDVWGDRGETRLELPAVDLPVSRTGLSVQYPPRYAIELRPGTFRVTTDVGPWLAALRTSPAVHANLSAASEVGSSIDLQLQVNRLTNEGVRRTAGILPVQVAVPSFGPSVFLAAELTDEGQASMVEISYRQTAER